jgi:sortase A
VARGYAAASVVALVIGVGCLGHSAWIYAKAFVAQRLIEAAWERTVARGGDAAAKVVGAGDAGGRGPGGAGGRGPDGARARGSGGAGAKPWPWADTYPVARLTLGRASGGLMVLEGASGRNLAFGPTHDPASVLPGERGNSVIEGHRDTHFGALQALKMGDVIRVELPRGRRESFVIVNLHVADSRLSRIALESATPRLTLVTCYPFDAVRPGGPLRYVVTADQMSESSNETISVGSLSQPAAGHSSGRSFAGM